MKTNVLIHEGVALKMDWVEKPDPKDYNTMVPYSGVGGIKMFGYYSDTLVRYDIESHRAKEKAIKERIEYEDQNAVIDLLRDGSPECKYQSWKPKDGIYVVDLPETETILQYTEPDNKSGYSNIKEVWIDYTNPDFAKYDSGFIKRKVARFKKEDEQINATNMVLPKYISIKNQVKDCVYKHASSSINGLPAIPEKNFEKFQNDLFHLFRITRQ